jgi:hypothetical protein
VVLRAQERRAGQESDRLTRHPARNPPSRAWIPADRMANVRPCPYQMPSVEKHHPNYWNHSWFYVDFCQKERGI